MITYSWKNIELSCHHNMYGKQEVAFAWSGTLVATDESGNTREKTLAGGLGVPGDSFIDSADITKEDAVSWIEASLDLESIKADLESQLTVFKIIKFE